MGLISRVSSRTYRASHETSIPSKKPTKMMQNPMAPIVLNTNTKRQHGREVQLKNVAAAKSVADIIRTCLGPRSMFKMLLDPMGGIVTTNDGNAILREIMVQDPAAKSMIETARSQDEEVGDGTTSVIILAGEFMQSAKQFLSENMHPTVIISAYRQALETMVQTLEKDLAKPIDLNNPQEVAKIVKSTLGTKFLSEYMDLAVSMAIKAVKTVTIKDEKQGSYKEIDIKRYAKVEKVPGGLISDSRVLNGVMINKDIVHSKMRRRIENPKILLLDCPLEYTKGESQTDIEIAGETDFTRLLQIEEEHIKKLCSEVIAIQPDVVITEKGVSDLAQHYFQKAGITAIRRVRKTDNNRIARVCGAQIMSRTDELDEKFLGTAAGLFEVRKLGDEYFTFIEEAKEATACTILLRGASKDILMEVERNLQDAMQVARNIALNPALLPGGGATEMAVSKRLKEEAKKISGVEQWPFKSLAFALEVIPRTLVQNCGASTIKQMTALRAKHAKNEGNNWGINGLTGEIADMNELEIYDPASVKLQTYKTAVETAVLLLRIDDIISGTRKADGAEGTGAVNATGDN